MSCNLQILLDNSEGFVLWCISYGVMNSNYFEIEDQSNIFQNMLDKYNVSHVFSLPSDPKILLKINNDTALFFRKFEDNVDLSICNSSESSFSSLSFNFNIKSKEFVEILINASYKFTNITNN